MARKIQIHLFDDMTGAPADETVQFALDGVTYEIDLTTDNADEFRAALGAYLKAARRIGGRARRGRTTPPTGTDLATIRAWGKDHGHRVSDRGRIPASLRIAYENAETSQGFTHRPA